MGTLAVLCHQGNTTMRTTSALIFFGLFALALAVPAQVDTTTGLPYKVADKVFLAKQKDVLRLFKHVFQPIYYKDQAEIASTWVPEQQLTQYTNQKVVKEFLHYYKQGFLPRGEVFSIFYEEHREQAVALFHVLYYAQDWDTFYKTACWARQHVNEGMFVYAMHVAVLHRHDTQGIVLPPIYEVYPHMFVNSEVIDKAYEIRMKHVVGEKPEKFVIQANHTGWYLNTHPTSYDLSYFTDDVGLNAWYYYYHIDYPFWMGGEEFGLHKDRRGELYYFVHQQLLARYYLERLSNDWGSIPVFDWKEPVKTGYVPSMRYPNGLEFPIRPAYVNLVYNPHNQPFTVTGEDSVFRVQEIEDYERRIRDVIERGYFFAEDGTLVNIYDVKGFDLLGRLVEASPDSPNARFYGHLQVIARQVLGYSSHPIHEYQVHPSVLEHFETALRDPVFYQFYKRITYYFLKYKSHLPHYTYTQLHYPGVTVDSVHVDKLVTYFEPFEFDITNILPVTEEEVEREHLQVHASQLRLTHRPFTYTIGVTSDKVSEVVVRVFLGPKYDEQDRYIPLNENRVNFVEVDKFVHTLQTGKNTIVRTSRPGYTARDRTTYRALYEKVLAAERGEKEFHLDMSEAHNAFPERLVVPMGKHGGQVYQFYVYVSPHKPVHEKLTYDRVVSAGVGTGQRYIDDLPFGFPFDRQIVSEKSFFVPNSYVEDVVIFHNPIHHHVKEDTHY